MARAVFGETPQEILHKRQNPRISRAQKDLIKEIEGYKFGGYADSGWQKTPTGYTFTRQFQQGYITEYGNIDLQNEFNEQAQKDPLDEWIEEWIRKHGG